MSVNNHGSPRYCPSVTTPRHQLIDPEQPLFYHLVSRCVRKSWLCGRDRRTRKDYTHRKTWLIQRLHQLAKAFPVEVHAYAIMSNHFHLVVFYDPLAAQSWSDREVATRWLVACPIKARDGSIDRQKLCERVTTLSEDPQRIAQLRQRLGSLSVFMQLLKQPIARRANLEDQCLGHFFEQRFYSGALMSEAAIHAAMAYVDLNPIRARIAQSIASCEHTSVAERLRGGDAKNLLDEALTPLVSGLEGERPLTLSFRDYLLYLETLIPQIDAPASKPNRWQQQMALLKKHQRVYGPLEAIRDWVNQRGMQLREQPLT